MALSTRIPANQWYVAAYGSEVGDALFARTICGEPIVFYRAARDFATEDEEVSAFLHDNNRTVVLQDVTTLNLLEELLQTDGDR
jgi:hypothetical protein